MKIVDGNLMLLIDDVGAMADYINDGVYTGVNLDVVDTEEKVTEEEVVKANSALGEDFESDDEISGHVRPCNLLVDYPPYFGTVRF